jgi:hypothetical protein
MKNGISHLVLYNGEWEIFTNTVESHLMWGICSKDGHINPKSCIVRIVLENPYIAHELRVLVTLDVGLAR